MPGWDRRRMNTRLLFFCCSHSICKSNDSKSQYKVISIDRGVGMVGGKGRGRLSEYVRVHFFSLLLFEQSSSPLLVLPTPSAQIPLSLFSLSRPLYRIFAFSIPRFPMLVSSDVSFCLVYSSEIHLCLFPPTSHPFSLTK